MTSPGIVIVEVETSEEEVNIDTSPVVLNPSGPPPSTGMDRSDYYTNNYKSILAN